MKLIQLLLGCYLVFAVSNLSQAANTFTVKIISFNDFHGNLESPGMYPIQPGGPGTNTFDTNAGGADMLAAYINALKEENPNNAVVSAGDLIGASPLISGYFHDEATIEIMNQLGLDYNAVGNHEFDEGLKELQRMQNGGCHPHDANSCKGPNPMFFGAKFKFLAANVINSKNHKPIFPAYAIKTFKAGQNKFRVAFIGLPLKETPQIVNPNGVQGLIFKDEVESINALIPTLLGKGVQAIVVLLHQGTAAEPATGSFINDCSATFQPSPLADIVSKLDNAVDLVISGHSHTGFICHFPNRQSRPIPVTQANSYGKVITDIDLTIDERSGDVTKVIAKNLTIDRHNPAYQADPKIKAIIDHYAELVQPLQTKAIGSIAEQIDNHANNNGENAAGDLIADAQLQATSSENNGGAQIALINPGGIRGPGFIAKDKTYPYRISYGEAFNTQPFGNTLVTMNLTSQQIKDALEQQFIGQDCSLSDGVSKNRQTVRRILQVSKGLHVEWSEAAPACSKIRHVSLSHYDESGNVTTVDSLISDGVVTTPMQIYRITVSDYLSTGGDNFSVFKLGTDRRVGEQDVNALAAYLGKFLPPNPPYKVSNFQLIQPRLLKLP